MSSSGPPPPPVPTRGGVEVQQLGDVARAQIKHRQLIQEQLAHLRQQQQQQHQQQQEESFSPQLHTGPNRISTSQSGAPQHHQQTLGSPRMGRNSSHGPYLATAQQPQHQQQGFGPHQIGGNPFGGFHPSQVHPLAHHTGPPLSGVWGDHPQTFGPGTQVGEDSHSNANSRGGSMRGQSTARGGSMRGQSTARGGSMRGHSTARGGSMRGQSTAHGGSMTGPGPSSGGSMRNQSTAHGGSMTGPSTVQTAVPARLPTGSIKARRTDAAKKDIIITATAQPVLNRSDWVVTGCDATWISDHIMSDIMSKPSAARRNIFEKRHAQVYIDLTPAGLIQNAEAMKAMITSLIGHIDTLGEDFVVSVRHLYVNITLPIDLNIPETTKISDIASVNCLDPLVQKLIKDFKNLSRNPGRAGRVYVTIHVPCYQGTECKAAWLDHVVPFVELPAVWKLSMESQGEEDRQHYEQLSEEYKYVMKRWEEFSAEWNEKVLEQERVAGGRV